LAHLVIYIVVVTLLVLGTSRSILLLWSHCWSQFAQFTQPLTGSPNLSHTHPTSHRLTQPLSDSPNLSQNHPTSYPTSLILTRPLTDSPTSNPTSPTHTQLITEIPPTSHRLTQICTDSLHPLMEPPNLSQRHPSSNRLTHPLREAFTRKKRK
jgi:hypothetical protein